MYLNLRGTLLSLQIPQIMGILNVTSDSFYAASRMQNEKAILKRVERIQEEGASIVDIGAVSTRPGSLPITEAEEIEKITSSLALIFRHFPDIHVSVDTWRANVAKASVEEGAAMINDISGGTFDENMIPMMKELKVPYCITHTSGEPEVMQERVQYNNMISDIFQFFGRQIEKCKEFGLNDILIDPGFGFGKTLDDNYLLLKNLSAFSSLQLPILIGISRKSMIYNLLDITPTEALNGTSALHIVALQQGANILRVHDVKEANEVVKLYMQLQKS